jgi:hypothetical protein
MIAGGQRGLAASAITATAPRDINSLRKMPWQLKLDELARLDGIIEKMSGAAR